MAKHKLYKQARALRKQGLSYKEIRERIGVSKSTLSSWLKDVALTDNQRKRLYTKQIEILSRGPKSQRERRKKEVDLIITRATSEIPSPISDEAFKLFGAALYWAEGNKGKNCGITNSDPCLIVFMIQWLKKLFHISPDMLKPSLNMYAQQNEDDIKKFWSDLTGIPLKNFGKSYIKPPNKNFKKNNLYYGTLKIYIPKGTNIKHIIYGWCRGVLQSLENKVDYTERKWAQLQKTPRPVNLYKNAPIA